MEDNMQTLSRSIRSIVRLVVFFLLCCGWSYYDILSVLIPPCRGAQFEFVAGNSSTHGDFQVQAHAPGYTARSNFTPYFDSHAGKLWLTHFHIWDTGRIVYNHSVPLFTNTSQVVSFNVSLQFQILSSAVIGQVADGLAFFISPSHDLPRNSSGGVLALYPFTQINVSDRHFFAVEFDTFLNDEYGDVSYDHIGIDFNAVQSAKSLDTTNTTLSLYRNSTLTAKIQYAALTHQISVWVAPLHTPLPSTPTLTAIQDLSSIFAVDQDMYVGVSATSGMGVQGSALISLSFASENAVTSPRRPPPPPPARASPPLLPRSSPPGRPPFLPSSPPTHHHSKYLVPLAGSLAGTFLVVCLVALILAWRRIKARRKLREKLRIMIESNIAPPRFDYKDLKKATRGFSDKEKVGEGGFSSVYKGTLVTGDIVAVKRLKEGMRMEAEFASEIQMISKIRHRNLLRLHGWGYEAGEALLVYPFMPNGSLDSYLFGKKKEQGLLDSEKRFNILIDVATALEYLHGGLGECLLHRDVKAANVLLTENFEAMLGDFGLARVIKHNQSVTVTLAGTPGYVAPEVVYTGRATDKADVYSYGVMALEVACGRRVLDGEVATQQEVHLVEWVWLLHQRGMIMNALDLPLQMQEDDTKKWECVLHVGLLCCHPWQESRPSMHDVLRVLQDCTVLPVPPSRPIYGPNQPPAWLASPDSQSTSSF